MACFARVGSLDLAYVRIMWRSVPLRRAFWLFSIAFVLASAVHLINRAALYEAGVALRGGATVITADDPAYLTPAERWLAGDGWRTYEPGTAAFVGRSPGYGLVYALLRFWLPPDAALSALFWLQIVLFSLAVALLPRWARRLGMPARWALFAALAVAVLPLFSGFLSYTLTEGLVPSLVVIALALLAERRPPWVWLGALLLGWVILIRPAMIIWLLALVWALLPNGRHKPFIIYLAALVLAMGPLCWWQWHSYQKTGRIVGLHPIYHWDSNDLYRPTHQAVWGFHKSWGHRGEGFHRAMDGLWTSALACLPARQAVDEVIAFIPQEVTGVVHPDSLRTAYAAYYRTLQLQAPYFERGMAMPMAPDLQELEVVGQFERLRRSYQHARPFHAYLGVPVRVYVIDMAAHSNLSLYLFQKTLRGQWWMETLRWLSAGFHLGLFLLFPVALCGGFRQKWGWPVAVPVAGYLIYLAFIQRGVEERYTLPVLIPMWLVCAAWLTDVLKKERRRLAQSD